MTGPPSGESDPPRYFLSLVACVYDGGAHRHDGRVCLPENDDVLPLRHEPNEALQPHDTHDRNRYCPDRICGK
jgi:hypothetical protein